MKYYVLFKYNVQDAKNPDRPDMYHLKQFDFPQDALFWFAQNERNIHDVIFTKDTSLTVVAS